MSDEPTLESMLDAITARCDAATEGPWLTGRHSNPDCNVRYVYPEGGDPVCSEVCSTYGELEKNVANSDFIAASRTDVPRLLKALEYILAIEPELGGRITRIMSGEEPDDG